MQIHEGRSAAADAVQAVHEATAGWPADAAPDMIFVFHSSEQDASAVAAELARRFPGAQMAGCSTAGEYLAGQRATGDLVMTGITSPHTRWAVTVAERIDRFDAAAAETARDRLLALLGCSKDDLDPARHVCVAFMDGLAQREETVAACVADALGGVHLVGGSAGDDLHFTRTRVIANGVAYDGAAVLVLADCRDGFRVMKHQHFASTHRRLVVTRVGPEPRRVVHLDGLPAAETYARLLEIPRASLTEAVALANPLALECNGELYVRSVQRIAEDGSIFFLCAMEEGMVLDVVRHLEIGQALADFVAHTKRAQFTLLCNCILRAQEAEQLEGHDALGAALRKLGEHVIGFDTYGEQFDGLHINQTIVGLSMGETG